MLMASARQAWLRRLNYWPFALLQESSANLHAPIPIGVATCVGTRAQNRALPERQRTCSPGALDEERNAGGKVERGHLIGRFSGNSQPLAAGCQRLDLWRAVQDCGDHVGSRLDQVLAVVEDEQHLFAFDCAREVLDRMAPGWERDAE